MIEIAGNDDIRITVLVRDGAAAGKLDGQRLFLVPVQARPGWSRIGIDVKVANVLSGIRKLKDTGAELEHVYDY